MRSYWILLFMGVCIGNANGQYQKPVIENDGSGETCGTKSGILTSKCIGSISVDSTQPKWMYELKNLTKKHDVPNPELLNKIKREKLELKRKNYDSQGSEQGAKSQVNGPVVHTNFLGTEMYNGTPPDNVIAISNGGYLVCSDNSSIEFYSDDGTYLLTRESHFDFLNDATLTSSIFDPKVLYDSEADRFIFVILHTNTSGNRSDVLISFSKTNNPMQGWWYYKLSGNPLNDDSWLDYPSIGISNSELFITGNLFHQGGGFNKSVIFQIDKSSGYSGNTLSYQTWSDLSSNPFSLCAISHGQQGNYGPGLYFVSTKSTGANEVSLYNLTDSLNGNPAIVHYPVATSTYSPSADAAQLGNSNLLDNGDCRIQSGFYLNGIIHYVFSSDIGSGYCGINYNRLTLSNKTNKTTTYGVSGTYDYSYPSVASFATSITDKSVAIAFLRSGATIYPEVRVANCNEGRVWSYSVSVQEGITYVDLQGGDERWGDYTRISRKHNSSSPRVWMVGCFADNNYKRAHGFSAWVAEIGGNVVVPTENIHMPAMKPKVYPNPVSDLFNLEFELKEVEEVEIVIVDINGKVIKSFYKELTNTGVNRLTFNKNALSAGIYFLKVESTSKIIANEKFIVK